MDWIREEEIRRRALQIWEDEGKPEGKDQEHWARAERSLDGEAGSRETGGKDLAGLAEGSKTERTAEDLKSGKNTGRR